MAYQGAGINGADGLGLRLRLPKKVKKGLKRLGRGLKKVVRSPIFKGAVIGAAGGYVYGRIRKGQKARKAASTRQAAIDRANAELDRLGPPKLAQTPGGIPIPSPVPYIEPPMIPTGGMTPDGSGFSKVNIANKIMRGEPLTDAEMAYVRSGALGQGMLAAAEAAYGNDVYVPGEGQPLPGVTVTAEKDNTILYAGLGLLGLLMLTQNKRGA